jgi:hypothetical protein
MIFERERERLLKKDWKEIHLNCVADLLSEAIHG